MNASLLLSSFNEIPELIRDNASRKISTGLCSAVGHSRMPMVRQDPVCARLHDTDPDLSESGSAKTTRDEQWMDGQMDDLKTLCLHCLLLAKAQKRSEERNLDSRFLGIARGT